MPPDRKKASSGVALIVTLAMPLLWTGCNTPYNIGDPFTPSLEKSHIQVTDLRPESAKIGAADRRNAIYRLSDIETAPNRIDTLRSAIARRRAGLEGQLRVNILEYEIVILAGKSESQMSPTYGAGVIGGLLSGVLKGMTAPPLNLDLVLVAIGAEVNGRPVTVWTYKEFEGLRDMPVARKALANANREAVAKFLTEAGI